MKSTAKERMPLYRMRSQEAASEMEALLASKHYAGSVDRAYYAVFHMTQALLASVGLEYSSHEAVIAAFGREFAKTKKLDPKLHRTLRRAFDLRLTADYDVETVISEEEANDLISECREFLASLGASLDKHNI